MKSRSGSLFLALVSLTAINASYLAAVDSPTIFYYANVLGHVGLGLILALALGPFFLRLARERAALAQRGDEPFPAQILPAAESTLEHSPAEARAPVASQMRAPDD